MSKTTRLCHSVGIFLLTVYFVFNGLSHIFNFDRKGLAIDTKISNTESYMIMRDINVKITNYIPFFYNQDN